MFNVYLQLNQRFKKYTFKLAVLLNFFLISNFFFFSCNSSNDKNTQTSIDSIDSLSLEKTYVDYIIIDRKVFGKEIVATGKLKAFNHSSLAFEKSGVLSTLKVEEGDRVSKGKILAQLDNRKGNQELKKAEIDIEKTNLKFLDILIGRGYDIGRQDTIPEAIIKMAKIRSGYNESLHLRENAQIEISQSKLIAPFSGLVANLKFNRYDQVPANEDFLTLIDDSYFFVEFKLIESELDQIFKNQKLKVYAFSSKKEYEAKITNINPFVDENGTIRVKAKITGDNTLAEGMNVRIILRSEVPDQFVVPKEAVLIRQDQSIIFKYTDGKAFWTYVKILNENQKQYSIIPDPEKNTARLNAGDTIIVSNNDNLAHQNQVLLFNKRIDD